MSVRINMGEEGKLPFQPLHFHLDCPQNSATEKNREGHFCLQKVQIRQDGDYDIMAEASQFLYIHQNHLHVAKGGISLVIL